MKSDSSNDSIIKKKKDLQGKPSPEFWIPDDEFERSDFPFDNNSSTERPIKNKKTSAQTLSQEITKSQKPDPKVSGWAPPALRSSYPGEKTSGTSQGNHEGRNQQNKTEPSVRDHKVHLSRPQKDQQIQPSGDASLSYLKSMILEQPVNTLHLLRNWYFKKYIPGSSGIESIHPHDRIFIILASAGEQITGKLFEIMSPSERQNFIEILSENKEFNSYQVLTVRTEFMNSVSNL
ncbi:MAG: hypothetical protein OEZ34_03690 [Spirochaetia bacterium]|nr:hypothetical protein [Spirochaetia bacterium]